MVVRIRLQRFGRRGQPFYRVVVADARAPRDGKFIEIVGTYNPIPTASGVKEVTFKVDRVRYWVSVGAQPSDRVQWLLGQFGILPPKVVPVAQTKKHLPRAERNQVKSFHTTAAAPASLVTTALASPVSSAPTVGAKRNLCVGWGTANTTITSNTPDALEHRSAVVGDGAGEVRAGERDLRAGHSRLATGRSSGHVGFMEAVAGTVPKPFYPYNVPVRNLDAVGIGSASEGPVVDSLAEVGGMSEQKVEGHGVAQQPQGFSDGGDNGSERAFLAGVDAEPVPVWLWPGFAEYCSAGIDNAARKSEGAGPL